MARPTKRRGASNIQFVMRIPAGVKRVLDGLPASYRPKGWGKQFITISTGTADRRTGAAEHARIKAEIEERFAPGSAGKRTLSRKEAVALAGEVYEGFAKAGRMTEAPPLSGVRRDGPTKRRMPGILAVALWPSENLRSGGRP